MIKWLGAKIWQSHNITSLIINGEYSSADVEAAKTAMYMWHKCWKKLCHRTCSVYMKCHCFIILNQIEHWKLKRKCHEESKYKKKLTVLFCYHIEGYGLWPFSCAYFKNHNAENIKLDKIQVAAVAHNHEWF